VGQSPTSIEQVSPQGEKALTKKNEEIEQKKEAESTEEPSIQERIETWLRERYPHTVLQTLGIHIDSYDADRVVVSAEVSERLFQPMGIVHGGIYVLMAETAASIAAAMSIDPLREVVMGMEINANHLRPVSEGTLRAISSPLHKGRTTMVYHIDILDQKDRRVAVSRCTMARRLIGEAS
jgi:1,4-dihydroxy-2-naphthoyl-CoA hydrolase